MDKRLAFKFTVSYLYINYPDVLMLLRMKYSFNDLRSVSKNTLFWILNIGGWLGISILTYIYDRNELISWHYFYLVYTYYILGLAATLILRKFYRSLLKEISSIPLFLITVLVYSLISTLLIYVVRSIMCLPLYINPGLLQNQQIQILKDFFLQSLLTANMLIIFLVICGWSTLYIGISFWFNLKEEQDRTNQANYLARNAQFEMLCYQLNPHFLFNSLNSVCALADDDPKAAKTMITELSEFLRYSLLSNNKTLNPLEYELDAIKNYLSIEKKRFQDNLHVEFDIDPGTKEIPVINFLIQPFVENAIKFGMRSSPMPLSVRISSVKTAGSLKISVFNTGHWVEQENPARFEEVSPGTGTGLANAIKRLEIIYPGMHRFYIEKEPSFVRVNIEIVYDHGSKRV